MSNNSLPIALAFYVLYVPLLSYYCIIYLTNIVLISIGNYKAFIRNNERNLDKHNYFSYSPFLPPITFVVPVFNQKEQAFETIQNVIDFEHITKEIIVVNDGSTDESFSLLKEKYQLKPIFQHFENKIETKKIKGVYRSLLYPFLCVLDKENGRKSDAVNAGINATQNPYLYLVDPDTLIDQESFYKMLRPLFDTENLLALGTNIRIRNGSILEGNSIKYSFMPKNYWLGMQIQEYIRSFLIRMGWERLGGISLLAGSFSLFHVESIRKVGGFFDTPAEDMEIILRLLRYVKKNKLPYKIRILPDPVAWTNGPSTFKDFIEQRSRWQFGILETIFLHKKMLFNFKYGFYGFFAFPWLIFAEACEPLFVIAGMLLILFSYLFNLLSIYYFVIFLLVLIMGHLFFSITSILIDELGFKKYKSKKELLYLVVFALFEFFGYRQVILFASLKGIFRFLKNFKNNFIKLKIFKSKHFNNL